MASEGRVVVAVTVGTTSRSGSATGHDPRAARAGAGRDRGGWCHRHQRRLPPGHPRLVRCLLLERDVLTSGTTWHAAGLITSAGMVDETALFMSRYSRDLYERLEQETGLSTGFRAVGHISVATNSDRMDALRREAKFVHGFGVEDHELSTDEIAALWPMLRTEDVVGGFYVGDEGRADPVGVAMSLARGARTRGVTIFEGVPATGVTKAGGRVTGVVTEQGTIEAEYVVNCGGMWARQFGAAAGVDVPLQAAEHCYLITEPMEGIHRDLPVVEDPDCYGYFRPEGDGLLVGLFEPVAAPWSLDGVPAGSSFVEFAADFDRLAPFLDRAMARVPALADTGIRKFFCGRSRSPRTFTRCSGRHPSSTTTSWRPGSTRSGSPRRRRGNRPRPLDRRR